MRLKEWRVKKLLGLKELAELAGVAVSTLTAIERGRELPSLKTARKLAEALQADPQDIDEVRLATEKALQPRRKFAIGMRVRANDKAPGDYKGRGGTVAQVGPGKSEYGIRFEDGDRIEYLDSWDLDSVG